MAFEIEFWIEEEKASIYLLQKDWSWVIFMPVQIRLSYLLFEGNYSHVMQLFFSHLRHVCVTLEAEMKQCNVLYDTASSFWWDVRFSRKSIYFHLIFFGSEETRVQLFLPHIGKAYPRRRELHKLRESFVILPPFLKFVPTEWLWESLNQSRSVFVDARKVRGVVRVVKISWVPSKHIERCICKHPLAKVFLWLIKC